VFYFERKERFKQPRGNSLHRFTRDEKDRFYRICRHALSLDTLGMKCSSERARLPLRKSDGQAGIIVTRDFICIRFHILFPQPVGCHSSIAARTSINRGERVLSPGALKRSDRIFSRHLRRIENRTRRHLTRINREKPTRYLFLFNVYFLMSRARKRNSRLFSRRAMRVACRSVPRTRRIREIAR